MNEVKNVEQKVINYWTERSNYFIDIRKEEYQDKISKAWVEEIVKYIPDNQKLKILDIGTGAGYFAILLSKRGYSLTGIDLTSKMIENAKEWAKQEELDILFYVMDAQELKFDDESFDVVVSRNLTWTLPEPVKAYKEWYRVLKKGGIMLNFDANYGEGIRKSERQFNPKEIGIGHKGVTKKQYFENIDITLSMEISDLHRPNWDVDILKQCGFKKTGYDLTIGERIMKERDMKNAPMFLVWAVK